jgi:hypothetical protein
MGHMNITRITPSGLNKAIQKETQTPQEEGKTRKDK